MTQNNDAEQTNTTQTQHLKKTPPSGLLSPEERQQRLDDGWDLEGFDALFSDNRADLPDYDVNFLPDVDIPDDVFLHGFAISARRLVVGYVVELWFHTTGYKPLLMLMRPRSAIRLADTIDQASGSKSGIGLPKSVMTDFDQTIRVYRWLHGAVHFRVDDDMRVSFARPQAKRLVVQLREAAVAHKPVESTTLAA